MTEETQPDLTPQTSEPPDRDGPPHPEAQDAGEKAAATIRPSSSPALASTGLLRWHEKRAITILRRLGADPEAIADKEEGRWPSTWQSFLWDLAPDKVVPMRDGVVLPLWREPQWLADLPDDQVHSAREIVRADLERSLHSVTALELKASRLLTPFVALLTGAVALTIFQVAAVDTSVVGLVALVGACLGACGIAFLLVGMLRALDADTRLGTSARATLEQELHDDGRFALRSDAKGAAAARFVLRMKGSRVLFARAAISRGLVMVLLSSIAGATALAMAPDVAEANQPVDKPSPLSPTPVGTPTHTPTSTFGPAISPSKSPNSSPTVSPTPMPPSGRTARSSRAVPNS